MRLLIGIAGAGATCAVVAYAVRRRSRRSSARVNRSNGVVTTGALGLIGNTPLVRINSLSAQTGCEILAKCEFLNPGGSSKDRVALAIIREAEASGKLKPGGTIVEATAGSTGVSLALAAKACGYRCLLVAADDVSPEKLKLIRALGATLEVVKPASIANPQHPVNVARRRAAELGEGSVFADQFNNLANGRVHESSTGEEIWAQTRGAVDAFVMGAGTGGTLAGVVSYLKSRKPSVRAFLADPPGSALYNRVKHGVLYASQQQERSQRRHRYDTIIEGVGCDRVTANFANAKIDDAIRVEGERGCTSCTSFFSAPCCLNMSALPLRRRVPPAPSFGSLPSLPQWRALPTSCTPSPFLPTLTDIAHPRAAPSSWSQIPRASAWRGIFWTPTVSSWARPPPCIAVPRSRPRGGSGRGTRSLPCSAMAAIAILARCTRHKYRLRPRWTRMAAARSARARARTASRSQSGKESGARKGAPGHAT